jgi:hypothetical protein
VTSCWREEAIVFNPPQGDNLCSVGGIYHSCLCSSHLPNQPPKNLSSEL